MPFKSRVTNSILVVNLIVFAMWYTAPPIFMAKNFLVSWLSLEQGRYWTLLTSAFSHNMFFHFIINLFVLRSFGPILENVLGPKKYLQFYLTAAIISAISHACVSNYLMHEPGQMALGASGAVAGLILLFSLLFPKEKILLLGIIPLPAIFGALAFIALDIWGLVSQTQGGGLPIGHGAHLGGSLTGILFFLLFKKRTIKVL